MKGSRFFIAVVGVLGLGAAAAAEPGATNPTRATRTWQMGFSFLPPRPTVRDVIAGIDKFSQRAEIAAIHEELPWRELLAGTSPETLLRRDKTELVAYLRGKGLGVYFMGELNDGLSRGEEAPQLRALKRSITEPAVQQVYRDYLLAVARLLQPDYLGLIAETNLAREMAPAPVYAAMKRAANDTAAALRAAGHTAPLLFSVQVETAWGRLGTVTQYRGVADDFRDFPFAQIVGLSSYPYFAFPDPERIPANYYSRLLEGRDLPAMVVEGGWTSAAVGGLKSSPALQARYVARHAELLDSIEARALIQLLFADLDVRSFPGPKPANLPMFVRIGLVDAKFRPKPALAEWDALFARKLVR